MRGAEKSRLRSTLRKLRAVPDGAGAARDQEALDFLAMAAGIKPVYVAGRGGDDTGWREGVAETAAAMNFQAIEGALWLADDAFAGLPGWYAEAARRQTAGNTALYVCRARAVADEVRGLAAGGVVTVAQEARLLLYPACCVADHYARARALHATMYEIVRRAAGGDESRMAEMIETAEVIAHAEPADRMRIATAMALIPAPFASFNMCESCAGSADSPAAALSRRFAALALDIDRALYDALAAD